MVSVPASAVVVNFPDPGLEAAIREAIGKPTADIYDIDLIGLTTLDASNRGIVNLEGIQYCADLTILVLQYNEIVDVNALSGLTNLAGLYLLDNEIVDISPLSGLINLTVLRLTWNEIVDISALSGLTNLTTLWLYGNEIIDISTLSGLINLTKLDLYDNEIVDITALSGLTNLTWLDLQNNQIRDIAPLVNNAGIDSDDIVHLRNNLLAITPGSPSRLDIEALQDRGVNVEFDPQKPLAETASISVVVNFPDPGLEEAIRDAIGKPTGDIRDTDLIGLAALDARNRGIVNLEGIQCCTSLTSLDLSESQIVDISAVSGLTNLTSLYLGDNEIVDITAVSGLTNLTSLLLYDNQIHDIAPLVENPGIDSDDDVILFYNCLALGPGSSNMLDIEALQGRGVHVYFDPQN